MIQPASAIAAITPGTTAKGATAGGGELFALSMLSLGGDGAIGSAGPDTTAVTADPARQAVAAPGMTLPIAAAAPVMAAKVASNAGTIADDNPETAAVDPALAWFAAVDGPAVTPIEAPVAAPIPTPITTSLAPTSPAIPTAMPASIAPSADETAPIVRAIRTVPATATPLPTPLLNEAAPASPAPDAIRALPAKVTSRAKRDLPSFAPPLAVPPRLDGSASTAKSDAVSDAELPSDDGPAAQPAVLAGAGATVLPNPAGLLPPIAVAADTAPGPVTASDMPVRRAADPRKPTAMMVTADPAAPAVQPDPTTPLRASATAPLAAPNDAPVSSTASMVVDGDVPGSSPGAQTAAPTVPLPTAPSPVPNQAAPIASQAAPKASNAAEATRQVGPVPDQVERTAMPAGPVSAPDVPPAIGRRSAPSSSPEPVIAADTSAARATSALPSPATPRIAAVTPEAADPSAQSLPPTALEPLPISAPASSPAIIAIAAPLTVAGAVTLSDQPSGASAAAPIVTPNAASATPASQPSAPVAPSAVPTTPATIAPVQPAPATKTDIVQPRPTFIREVTGTPRHTISLRPQLTAQPQPAAGTTAPASEVFGAAMRAAVRPDDGQRAPPIDPAATAAPTMVTTATASIDATQPVIDMRPSGWPSAMVDHIAALRDAANANDTRIRLVPDALGTIDLTVKTVGDAIHVRFIAEDAATRAMIEDAQPRLAAIAQERGLRIGQSIVEPAAASHASAGGQPSSGQASPPPSTPASNGQASTGGTNAGQAQTGQQPQRQPQQAATPRPSSPPRARATTTDTDAAQSGRIA